MHYLIKFKNKQELRRIINGRHSSIYILNDSKYILIQSKYNPKISNSSLEIVNAFTNDEYELHHWAYSEINNTHNFVPFESCTELTDKGLLLISEEGEKIYRTFEPLTEIFGILNYTPDSFSDGGLYNTPEKAIAHANYLLDSGVETIDIGVESTRPGANVMTAQMEIATLQKLLPHILEIKREFKISIDSYHPETVKWLLNQDIDYINDVSGKLPLDLVREATNTGKMYIAMHSLSVPSSKDLILPVRNNPFNYLSKWLGDSIRIFHTNKINIDKVILDPGIGFGKNGPQSWYILKNFQALKREGVELLIGHSRKSFINHVSNKSSTELDMESALIATHLLNQVDYLRLHDMSFVKAMHPINSLMVQYR